MMWSVDSLENHMTNTSRSNVQKKVDAFFSGYPLKELSKGEILFHPGDTIDHVFYLTKGSIAQYDISQAGNEVVVNVFKQHAFFPMSAVMNHVQNDYFFEAIEPVEMHVIPGTDAVAFIKENPDVAYDLLSRVYRGTDGLLRRMAHLMGGTASTRLLFELLNAAKRYGAVDKNSQVRLPLTENDLAKRSGLSRETVSRTMHKLKEMGLVSMQKNTIVINDMAALKNTLGSQL